MGEMKTRSVAKLVHAVSQAEGEGMIVTRPFPTARLDHVDPFLLLDRMGPISHGPGEAKGAPDHPHRGFETVTYILEGAIEHEDSQGNRGRIGAGDVQWMTAGSGVIHSEMPSEELRRNGGRLHGFQLWVNLPRSDKMMKPRYQELRASEIPTATSADGKVTVTVIAGESLGTTATIDTRTPIMYFHVRLAAGARFTQPIPETYNAFAFVIGGEAIFGTRSAGENDAVFFENDGDEVTITSDNGAELLLLAGVPLNEPVARYGPFVMNTTAEIRQAMFDYQTGKFGEIVA
ncbi:MAG: quercetin 2,3-dioxygenase [Acidobacteriota bacterium]|jgi:redox-sensitive bicupin YhaK (pirin superfamily)|nr:quercetin 2,3-dioxygenase [Acidobacteriota bacterium]